MSDKKLRIAWFTELDNDTLSAYCSKLLLPLLQKNFEIEVFTATSCIVGARHYATSFERHKQQPFDLYFYQLEDSVSARFIRMHPGLMPGIVWAHNLYFQDQGPEGLFTSPWEQTLDQYWDSSKGFLNRETAPHQLWPQAVREVSLAPVIIFSSKWALAEHKNIVSKRIELYPGSQIAEYIPVPIVDATKHMQRAQQHVLRLSYASSAGVEGRAHKLFPALAQLRSDWKMSWMVRPEQRTRASALIEEFKLSNNIKFSENYGPDAWRDLLADTDIAMHLHRSPFGNVSPYLQISLQAGVPVILTDAVEGATFSDCDVFKISAGMFETAELKVLLERIVQLGVPKFSNKTLALAEHFRATLVADRLISLIREVAASVSECMRRWQQLQFQARRSLIEEVVTLNADASLNISPKEMLDNTAKEFGWYKSN